MIRPRNFKISLPEEGRSPPLDLSGWCEVRLCDGAWLGLFSTWPEVLAFAAGRTPGSHVHVLVRGPETGRTRPNFRFKVTTSAIACAYGRSIENGL